MPIRLCDTVRRRRAGADHRGEAWPRFDRIVLAGLDRRSLV